MGLDLSSCLADSGHGLDNGDLGAETGKIQGDGGTGDTVGNGDLLRG